MNNQIEEIIENKTTCYYLYLSILYFLVTSDRCFKLTEVLSWECLNLDLLLVKFQVVIKLACKVCTISFERPEASP